VSNTLELKSSELIAVLAGVDIAIEAIKQAQFRGDLLDTESAANLRSKLEQIQPKIEDVLGFNDEDVATMEA
jgi:hypothetical protein